MGKFFLVSKKSLLEFSKARGLISRNGIAFSLLMSIAPMVALLTIVSINVLKSSAWIQQQLTSIIPIEFVEAFIKAGTNTASLSFIPFIVGTVLTLYTASRGFYGIMLIFAEDYEDEIKSFAFLTRSILAVVYFCIIIIVVVGLTTFLEFYLADIIKVINYLITILVYYLITMVFFMIVNYPRKPIRTFRVGAAILALGLLFMSRFFTYIVTNFFNYSDLYGGLAYFFVFLLALVWMSMLIYYAHCVNVARYKIERGMYNE